MVVDCMIDWETLGTGLNSVPVSFGAVLFDPYARDITLNNQTCFSRNVEVQSCLDLGMTVDGSTFYWWLRQSEDARRAVSPQYLYEVQPEWNKTENKPRKGEQPFGEFRPIPIKTMLTQFALWYKANTDQWHSCLWSHGATFDIAMLAELYRKAQIPQPWKFHLANDTRTVFRMADMKLPNVDTREGGHNSLRDSIAQAEHLQSCLAILQGRPPIIRQNGGANNDSTPKEIDEVDEL